MKLTKELSRKHWPNSKIWPFVDEAKKESTSPKIINRILEREREVQNLVKSFYKKEFFDKIKLGELSIQEVADELFDTGVNQGVKTSAKYLQRALNALNQNERLFKDLVVDGMIGSKSINGFDKYVKYYSRYGSNFTKNIMLKALNGFQFMKYLQIVERNPEQEINFAGWLKRI